MQVTITQEHKYESSHDTYSSVSAEASASYGGLFYSGSSSGGFEKKSGNSKLTSKGSNLEIKFMVHKVLIHWPWLEPTILQYPTLGIKGLQPGSWSSGELNAASNKGQFPLLPTAFICAKDITVSASSYSETAEKSFSDESSHASMKVRKNWHHSLYA